MERTTSDPRIRTLIIKGEKFPKFDENRALQITIEIGLIPL